VLRIGYKLPSENSETIVPDKPHILVCSTLFFDDFFRLHPTSPLHLLPQPPPMSQPSRPSQVSMPFLWMYLRKNINGVGGRGATQKKYLQSRKPISPYGCAFTTRIDITKLIVSFRNFANTPN
jgi:hypothetical protein